MALESSSSDAAVICLLAIAGGFALGLSVGSCRGGGLAEKCRGRYASLVNRPPAWTSSGSRRETQDGVEYYRTVTSVEAEGPAALERAKREVFRSMRPLDCESAESHFDPCS